jgi:hypothetical protein
MLTQLIYLTENRKRLPYQVNKISNIQSKFHLNSDGAQLAASYRNVVVKVKCICTFVATCTVITLFLTLKQPNAHTTYTIV